MGQSILEPLVDAALDAVLEANGGEAEVAQVTEFVLDRLQALDVAVRAQALLEAIVGATGARLERRTMNGRDLVNLSTEERGAVVAPWSPDNERRALELRKKRRPERPLDS